MVEFKNCPSCSSRDIKPYLKTKDYFFTKEHFSIYQCNNCKLIFTNPRPEVDRLSAYYQSEEYLSHHSDSLTPVSVLYKFIREINIRNKYKTVVRYGNGNKILDIGCGTGELLAYFQKKGWSAIGVEPDAEARSFAEKKNGIKVYYLDYLAETEEKFDVISMWHVLEHVPDLHERIETVKKLLTKDGFAVIALPNGASHDAFYYKEYWAGLDVPRHLYHFSPYSFKKLMESHGFSLIAEIPMKFDVFYVSWLSEKYLKHKCPLLKGVLKGLIFNKKAKKSGAYSSKIYILKKKL